MLETRWRSNIDQGKHIRQATHQMKASDRDYFLERARNELEKAHSSDDPDAAKAHFQLAGLYLKKAHTGPAAKDLDRYVGAACGGRRES